MLTFKIRDLMIAVRPGAPTPQHIRQPPKPFLECEVTCDECTAGDTGCGDTGCGDTGCGDTGCGDTGCGDTGCGDTCGDTGCADSGCGKTCNPTCNPTDACGEANPCTNRATPACGDFNPTNCTELVSGVCDTGPTNHTECGDGCTLICTNADTCQVTCIGATCAFGTCHQTCRAGSCRFESCILGNGTHPLPQVGCLVSRAQIGQMGVDSLALLKRQLRAAMQQVGRREKAIDAAAERAALVPQTVAEVDKLEKKLSEAMEELRKRRAALQKTPAARKPPRKKGRRR
jgi:hypothetical protein